MNQEFTERIKKAFGSRFVDLREYEDDKFYLYLSVSKFSSIDLNNINTIGFGFHIGFVLVECTGHLNKCLRIHLRAY